MLKKTITTLLGSLVLLSQAALSQTISAVEFSAETLQIVPKLEDRVGRIFVGQDRLRIESIVNGEVVVTIIDPARDRSWVLYPDQQRYIEYAGGASETQGDALINPGNPCRGVMGTLCRRLGEEILEGRRAVKWELTTPGEQGRVRSVQWVDRENAIVLRHEVDQGPLMEQRLLGRERLNGRDVEKWERVQVPVGGMPKNSLHWFDRQLNLSIREEHPGGFIRELRNIEVSKQPQELFEIPTGFVKAGRR